jgi:hypothetical protein
MSQNDQQGTQIARQGHRYQFNGQDVIALSTGERVEVLAFNPHRPWRDSIFVAYAKDLIPMPMVYFGGQTPQ